MALENNPVFPTYPERIPEADISAGLVLPYAARALMGTGGALASFFLVFFAVTSAGTSPFCAPYALSVAVNGNMKISPTTSPF